MTIQDIKQDIRKLQAKLDVIEKDKAVLDKKKNILEKEEKEKQEALERKFYDEINKMFDSEFNEKIEYRHDEWWNDEGCDSVMITDLTEGATSFKFIAWNWKEIIDKNIKEAEEDVKSHTQHLEALKRFKTKFAQRVKEKR